MDDEVREFSGRKVLVCAPQGTRLSSEGDANAFIGATWGNEVELIAIPLERFGPEFLQLSNRIAGGVLQKFVNYKLRVAIMGDVSQQAATSKALRDFIFESNCGRDIWFVRDLAELERRLAET